MPVRTDLGNSELAKDPKFRFLQAPGGELEGREDVRGRAGGASDGVDPLAAAERVHHRQELGVNETLNRAASEVQELMTRGGHKTGRLPDLK